MLSFARSLILIGGLFLTAAGFLRADILTLANGDKLKGVLVKNVDGVITFKSDILGEIIVPTTKAKVEVELTEAQKAAQAKAAEEKRLAEAKAAEEKKPAKKPKATSFAAVELRDAAKTPTKATKVDDTGWFNKIEFGLTSQQGRTNQTSIAIYTQNNRRTPKTEMRFLNNYNYNKVDGVMKSDSLTSNLRVRRNLMPRLFFQSNTRYTHDKIVKTNTDAEQGLGFGSNVYARKMIVIAAGGDVAVRYRSYTTDVPDETTTVFNVFQDLTLTINPRFTLTQDFVAVINPSDDNDQKYNFNATLSGRITSTLSINTRVEIEYDKHKAKIPRDLRYNQRIATTIGYIF